MAARHALRARSQLRHRIAARQRDGVDGACLRLRAVAVEEEGGGAVRVLRGDDGRGPTLADHVCAVIL